METLEKLELRKEITDEIREELTRSNGNLITRRILLALAIIIFELLIWWMITTGVAKDNSVSDGMFISYLVALLRFGQLGFIHFFKGE